MQDTRAWHCSAMHVPEGERMASESARGSRVACHFKVGGSDRSHVAVVNRWCPWWLSVQDFGGGNLGFLGAASLPHDHHPLRLTLACCCVRTSMHRHASDGESPLFPVALGFLGAGFLLGRCPLTFSADQDDDGCLCSLPGKQDLEALPSDLQPLVQHLCLEVEDTAQQPMLDRAQAASDRTAWGFEQQDENPDGVLASNTHVHVPLPPPITYKTPLKHHGPKLQAAPLDGVRAAGGSKL